MRWIILMMLSIMLLGASCAHTVQKEPKGNVRAIRADSQLIKKGVTLSSVQGMEMPLAEHRYLLAKTEGMTEIKIQTVEDFAKITNEILSEDNALAFVRLITSQEIRPFLSDIYYSEVHKKVEPQQEGEKEDRWFAIETRQYNVWNLHEPVVLKENDSTYKIERFVASYPHVKEGKLTQAQLLKIWEWVDTKGNYFMEIQDVIAEGEPIQKLLFLTK